MAATKGLQQSDHEGVKLVEDIGGGNYALNVNVVSDNTAGPGTGTFSDQSVPDSGAELLSANPNRKTAVFYNNGSETAYLGKTNAVTDADGLPLPAGAAFEDDKTGDAWYAVTAAGLTTDIRIWEVA